MTHERPTSNALKIDEAAIRNLPNFATLPERFKTIGIPLALKLANNEKFQEILRDGRVRIMASESFFDIRQISMAVQQRLIDFDMEMENTWDGTGEIESSSNWLPYGIKKMAIDVVWKALKETSAEK